MSESARQVDGHKLEAISGARKLAMVLCICWGVMIIWLSLTPSPPKMSNAILGWDKLQHAAAYGLLTFLAIKSFVPPRKPIWPVFLVVVCCGGLMEVAQGLLTSNRTADILDLLANAVGAGAVSLIYFFFRQRGLLAGSRRIAASMVICAAVLGMSVESRGEDSTGATVTAEVKSAAMRIADEAVNVGKTPFDLENSGALATLFVAGAVAVTTQYDEDIRAKVATKKGGNLDRATDAGSIAGDPFAHLGIAAAVYAGGILGDSPKFKELGEMLGEAALLADATTLVLKQAIGRGRPTVADSSGRFRPFQFGTDYDSLPSMHTASSFAMASVVASSSQDLLTALASYSAAAFVGFSRIYQDKHWASDVLLGAAIGELCGRVVTRYHATASSKGVAIAPVVSDSSVLLSLVGRF